MSANGEGVTGGALGEDETAPPHFTPEMGIYKRKQELDQESDQENNEKGRKDALDQESDQEKK